MQFHKLRLSGFKSFAQATELLIEPGLTGVVGPNGCGKSNIVEALRWVMGETSARGLRGGEMDDVIFAGTISRPVFDLAEVVVHLNGAPVTLPGVGEVEEVELCRRIGRGSGSAYRINGRDVRARDVQLLFADAASGARSAAIISQGQIGALVEAKPAERRRLLEDAAGIGGLQARRHEAELKLQATEANLARIHDLLTTLEEQRERLKKQARQAKRYREISAAHREAEAALLIGRWQVARATLAAAEEAVEGAKAWVRTSAEGVAEARAARDRAAGVVSDLRTAEADAAAELARLGERRNAMSAERSQLEARASSARAAKAQAEKDMADARAGLDDARAMLARLDEEQATRTATRDGLAAEIAAAEPAEQTLRGAAEDAEVALRRAMTDLADVEARGRHLRDRRAEVDEQLAACDAAEEAARGRRQELAADDVDGGSDAEAGAAEDALRDAMAAAKEAEATLAAAAARREATRAELAEAERRLAGLQEEQRALETELRQRETRRQQTVERRSEVAARCEGLVRRRAELDERRHEREARRADLALDRLDADLAARQREVDAAASALAAAQAEQAGRLGDRDDARLREHEARAALERLQAEAAALAELAGPDRDHPGVEQAVVVQEGYAEALAAGLGDDLLAGLDADAPAHWLCDLEGNKGHAPDLPADVAPLRDFVSAPPALGRRLAQIGVVDAALAPALQRQLAQGQRLVSRDGGLWRWDGFVRMPAATRQAAARLSQQARRRALETEQTELARQLETRRAEAVAADEAVRTTAAAVQRCEAEHQDALARFEEARQTIADARTVDAALAAELEALAGEATRLDAEIEALRTTERELDDELGAQQQPLEGRDAAAHALRAAADDRDARAEDDAAAAAAESAARAAATAARERAEAAQSALERVSAAAKANAAAIRDREIERARLDAEIERFAGQRDALNASAAAIDEELSRFEAKLAGTREDYAGAEARLGEARARHGEAANRLARLEDRRRAAADRLAELAGERERWQERVRRGEARLGELAERETTLAHDLEALGRSPDRLAEEEATLGAAIASLEARVERLRADRAAAEARLAEAETGLAESDNERLTAREAGARLEAELERARAECEAAEAAFRARAPSAPVALPEEPPGADTLEELEQRLAKLGAARERIGPVNLRAVDELAELEQRIQTLESERDELSGAIERLRRAIASLNREGRERLRAAFADVEKHFEALFKRLFGGGHARLALTDLEDPLAAGLELAASPPGKKLQSISLLSGGEKALTALALLFAVFLTRPSPLCMLDEVDAPLDDANVGRFVDLLDEIAAGTETRFIVVTHHPITMARMHRLYGVTMLERGVSQLVSVDLQAAVALRATA